MDGPLSDRDRHYWRPSGDQVRHAFRGRRWDRQLSETSVCGSEVELWAEVTEEQWVMAASCEACTAMLQRECAERAEREQRTGPSLNGGPR